VQSSIEPESDRDILLRILTDFLFHRLPKYTHEQLAMMMKLTPLHETEGYKSMIRDATAEGMSKGLTQGLSEGRAAVLVRLAKHRFPKSDTSIDESIRNLDSLQLEQLTEMSLDLPGLPALRSWLKLD
jgi:predicted transposase YdaD